MVRFTVISVALYVVGHVTSWDYVSCLAIPLLWGVAASFSVAVVLDGTVYARMRRRNGWRVTTFVVGNAVLHFLPLAYPPATTRSITWWDGLRSSVTHLTWAWLESGGTFVLDDVYVPMAPWMWRACLGVAVVVQCVVVPAWVVCV